MSVSEPARAQGLVARVMAMRDWVERSVVGVLGAAGLVEVGTLTGGVRAAITPGRRPA